MSDRVRLKAQVHLYRRDDDGRLLFLVLQRTDAKGAIWQSVTGNVDPGETVEQCAPREVGEETGLTLIGEGVGEVSVYEFTNDKGRRFEEHVFGFEATGDVVLSHEHQAFRWVGADEALTLIHYGGIRDGLRHVCEALDLI